MAASGPSVIPSRTAAITCLTRPDSEFARVLDDRRDRQQRLAVLERDADGRLARRGLGDPAAVAADDPARVDVLADDDERHGRRDGQRAILHGDRAPLQAAMGTNRQPSTNSSKKSSSVSSSTCSIRPTSASRASRRLAGQQQAGSPVQRGVADADHAIDRDRREEADLDRVLRRSRRWRSRRRDRPGRPGRRSRPDDGAGSAGRTHWRPWPGRAGWRRSARSVMPCSGATRNSSRPSRKRPSVVHPVAPAGARRGCRRAPSRRSRPGRRRRSCRATNASPSSWIVSIAPSAPGIPKRSRPPSNAGPAGHEAAR